jgi:hypothetical protein
MVLVSYLKKSDLNHHIQVMAEKEKILTAHANNFITFWSILTDFIAIKKQSFCVLKIV